MNRIAVLALFAFHASLAVADESAQELVTKAVARSRAIKSGCFEFPLSADKKIEHNFAPGFWLHKADGVYDAEYRDTHITQSSSGKIVVITTKDPLKRVQFSGLQILPIFAGSFWKSSQADWVEQHIADFVRIGNEQIDGVETIICETYYKDPGAGPAIYVHPLLMPQKSNRELVRRIRLYIAPSLGHALPVYELYGGSDKVLHRWTATDFVQRSPGIFIAQAITQQLAGYTHLELDLAKTPTTRFRIKADKVNEPLDDHDLYFTIQAGAAVHDEEVGVRYTVKHDISSKDIVQLSDKARGLPRDRLGQPIGLDD